MRLENVIDRLDWIGSSMIELWTAMTVLMVLALVLVVRAERRVGHRNVVLVLALIAAVWLYPMYTGMTPARTLMGGVGIFALTGYAMASLSRSSRAAAHLLGPSLIVSALATAYLALSMLASS